MSEKRIRDPWARMKSCNGIPADELISMMQKSIRRGEEKRALIAAWEMYLSGPQLLDKAWRRLLVISIEDVGFGDTQAPEIIWNLYKLRQGFDYTDMDQPIHIVYAVRYLCQCKKDRSSDQVKYMLSHSFSAGWKPQVPDYVYDMHTVHGKELGLDEVHFLEEASKVSPQLDAEWVRRLHDDFVEMCRLEKTTSGRPLVDAFLNCDFSR